MKNKGKVIIAVASILIVIFAGVFIFLANSGDSYEQTAIKYAEAYNNFDYEGIKNELPYNVDEMFYDMFNVYCRENYLSTTEGLEWWADEFYTELDSTDGMLKKCCESLTKYVADDYKVTAKILNSREINDYEIEDIIRRNTDEYYEWGVDLFDYVDVNKIKKAYEVEVEVEFYEYEDTYIDKITYTIVKYSGEWCVLTIFNPEMY